jgi:hypothetical protein
MALAQGSIVALRRTWSTGITGFFGKKPLFGRITNVAAPWDILWENGLEVTGIPSSELDQISYGSVDPNVARIRNSSLEGVSGHYDVIKISKYSRIPEGTGTSGSFTLCRLINDNEGWFEVLSALLEDLENR